jgi:hypothetical protein
VLGVTIERHVLLSSPLKSTLKRGALVAAANWPVVVIQSVADSLFKALIAMPLVGGIFLVAIVVGAEPGALMSLAWRELIGTIVGSLISRPAVLAAFLASLAIVVIGGSLFVFLVKGGTIGVLVRGEQIAGAIEQPPLRYHLISRASAFSMEAFVEAAGALWPRFAKLGAVLMAVYLASGGLYLVFVLASRAGGHWAVATLVTGAFVAWITIVNLVYLLMQIVIAADDCGVASAWNRVAAFVRRRRRDVAAVFLVVLALVVFATGASLLATAALGLISFVPLLGLTVLPLQLIAWLFRALVFQYLGLSSVGAYVNLYRGLPAAAPIEADVVGSYKSMHPGDAT